VLEGSIPVSADVDLLGWDERHAVALVNGVKARVGMTHVGIRWSCEEHGSGRQPHCLHTRALARTPADPQKERTP
jgi:hypothetical protein